MNPESKSLESAAASETGFEKLSFVEKAGYGFGDAASNLYWKLFEYFQTYFYVDVFGIGPAAAGTMFLVTKIWDAINDPMIGFISDRTRTAWGRFRPYLIWMSIPFAITGMLTFYTPDLSPTNKLIYAYITYTLVFMAYTAINIPYGALLGVISPSSEERTSVSTYRFIFAFICAFFVQLFTLPLVEYFGGGTKLIVVDGIEKEIVRDPQTGFFWTVFCFAIAAVIMFTITFFTTKERVGPVQESPSNFKQDVLDLFKNRPWMVLLFVGLFQILAGWTRGSATTFYFEYLVDAPQFEFQGLQSWLDSLPNFLSIPFGFLLGILQQPGLPGNFLAAGTIFAILGMAVLTKPLVKLLGNKWVMILVMIGNGVCMGGFFVLEKDQWQMMYVLHCLGSFISGPMPILLWAMYADVADYSEWLTNRRATGLVFAAATFSQKLGSALGSALPAWTLAIVGYKQPIDNVAQEQSAETLEGIVNMMSIMPAIFFGLGCIAMLFYNINSTTLKTIEMDLKERKSKQQANNTNE